MHMELRLRVVPEHETEIVAQLANQFLYDASDDTTVRGFVVAVLDEGITS
jgi:hypothetical protein